MGFAHIAIAAVVVASSAPAKAPAHHVEGWARAGAASSAAYVAVYNRGGSPDRLLGASSRAARNVSIHNSLMAGGVMRMRPAGALPIAAGGRLAMRPGGLHVMLTGLKAPLKPGTKLPLTLHFKRAGTIQVSLPVLPPGSTGPSGVHHGH